MNLLVVVALASFVAAPVPKDPPKPPSLDGDWKVISLIKEGNPRPPEKLGGPVVIKGDKMTIREGTRDETVTIKLDPKTGPATIDLMPEKAGAAEQTIKGIYRVEKDRLTICYGFGDAERPKEFKSEPDSRLGLLVLERVKKE